MCSILFIRIFYNIFINVTYWYQGTQIFIIVCLRDEAVQTTPEQHHTLDMRVWMKYNNIVDV